MSDSADPAPSLRACVRPAHTSLLQIDRGSAVLNDLYEPFRSSRARRGASS